MPRKAKAPPKIRKSDESGLEKALPRKRKPKVPNAASLAKVSKLEAKVYNANKRKVRAAEVKRQKQEFVQGIDRDVLPDILKTYVDDWVNNEAPVRLETFLEMRKANPSAFKEYDQRRMDIDVPPVVGYMPHQAYMVMAPPVDYRNISSSVRPFQ